MSVLPSTATLAYPPAMFNVGKYNLREKNDRKYYILFIYSTCFNDTKDGPSSCDRPSQYSDQPINVQNRTARITLNQITICTFDFMFNVTT